jgi:hypothetical protein
MTRRKLLTLAGLAAAAGRLAHGQAVSGVDPVGLRLLSRRRALEAARRLCAEGWRMRDGIWTGTVGPARHLIPVHLIAGNTYVFVFGVRPTNPQQALSLLDAEGKLVAEKSSASDPGLAAVLYEVPVSGRHHVFLHAPSDAPPCEVAAVYLYR